MAVQPKNPFAAIDKKQAEREKRIIQQQTQPVPVATAQPTQPTTSMADFRQLDQASNKQAPSLLRGIGASKIPSTFEKPVSLNLNADERKQSAAEVMKSFVPSGKANLVKGIGTIDTVKAAWEYGQGTKLINEGYQEKMNSSDPAVGDDKIAEGMKLVQKNQAIIENEGHKFGEGNYLTETARAMVTPENWKVNMTSQMPLNLPLMAKSTVAGLIGNIGRTAPFLSAAGGAVGGIGGAIGGTALLPGVGTTAGAVGGVGVGTAAGLAVAAGATALQGKLIADVTMEEAKMEAAGVFQTVLEEETQKGVSYAQAREKALKAAEKNYAANVAVIAGTNIGESLLIFGKPLKFLTKGEDAVKQAAKVGAKQTAINVAKTTAEKIGKTVGTGLTEGGQELVQYGAQQWATEKPIDLDSPEAKENFSAGFNMGGGTVAVGSVGSTISELSLGKATKQTKAEVITNLPDQVMPQVMERVNEEIAKGNTPQDALNIVLDEIGNVEGLETIIGEAMQKEAKMQEIAKTNPAVLATSGQTVYDAYTGESLIINDDTLTDKFIVTNAKGQKGVIDREDVTLNADVQTNEPSSQPGSIVYDKQGNALTVVDDTKPEFYVVEDEAKNRRLVAKDEVTLDTAPNLTQEQQEQVGEEQIPTEETNVAPQTTQNESEEITPVVQGEETQGIEQEIVSDDETELVGESAPKAASTELYHGTNQEGLENIKGGSWFTPNKDMADKFASGRTKEKKGKANTYSVQVDLSNKNLADISKFGIDDYVTPKDIAQELGIPVEEVNNAFLQDIFDENMLDSQTALRYITEMASFTELLKAKGFDGIKAKEGLNAPDDYVPTYKLFDEVGLKTDSTKESESVSNEEAKTDSIKIGDTVYGKQSGTAMEVLSVDNEAGSLRVKSSTGNIVPIKIDKVSREKPVKGQKVEAKPVSEQKAEPVAEKADEQTKVNATEQVGSPAAKIAEFVKDKLNGGKKLGNPDLWKIATEAYGGTQSQGKFTPKDAYDAMELGVNKWLLEQDMFTREKDSKLNAVDYATLTVNKLQKMLELLPTQANRTAEMDEFQQFSTPPSIAYIASWAANISANDTVLEPSAGIGGLAVFGKIAGAKVIVNELSTRRAEVIKEMNFDQLFTENAEQINNILPKDVKPTVVIMNPPFSSTAGRTKGKNDTRNAIVHVEQALKRLEPGGRLVAIVGRGMANNTPTFKDWWDKLRKEYTVQTNIGINGKNYSKYGTSFDVQIVVIDKIGPNKVDTIIGRVDKLEDILPLLEGIRNDRTRIEPAASESTGEKAPTESQSETRLKPIVSVPTDGMGTGEREGSDSGYNRPTGEQQPSGSNRTDNDERRTAEGDGAVDETGASAGSNMARPEGINQDKDTRGSGTISSEQPESSTAKSDARDPGHSTGEINVEVRDKGETKAQKELKDEVYSEYVPQKLKVPGAKPHPADLVQSSAMASVEPPTPTYKPNLPAEVIKEGKLSLAQIEAIVYAGQSHQETLLDGQRRGFFIGDGTGVGKGREISAIILDNMRQGRKKAVWVSINKSLLKDAQRDYGDIGGDASIIFDHGKIKNGFQIAQKEGIIFTTYTTLGAGQSANADGSLSQRNKDMKSRLDQIVQWLGKDFDGVIAFDEAHQMQNSLAMKGARGTSKPAAMALAGVELQARLPNARVVYVSATGATEVENLAYADRLGLWGKGTPFADKRDFVSKVKVGGLAAMELVARDMKSMGMYIARNIGFNGVRYSTLEHKLTNSQTEVYDTMAEGWQIVLQNINEALKVTGAVDEQTGAALNSQAKKNAMGAFWSAQQRFFNQVLTSMQMPTAIKSIKKDIEDGKSVVIQLVNTNEAQLNRALSSLEEGQTLEDLDMTPRGQLMMFLDKSFPVWQYENYVDEDGNVKSRPVLDSMGNNVVNQEALAMKEELLSKIGAMKVPDGPLEILLNELGADKVAEITGRSRRVVRAFNDDTGRWERKTENRTKNDVGVDETAFMDDRKQILVFSNAGGTGRSYHADRTRKNQRPRKHYLLQAGWTASTAVQGFGRTHRSNQASAPEYALVTTDLKGQKRFMSSIARRLDQLGALTKGQRQAAGQGLFSEKDNLEGPMASDALVNFYSDLSRNRIEGLNPNELLEKMGLTKLVDEYGNLKEDPETRNVPKFLNRLLSLESSLQNRVFDEFADRLEALVEIAIANGTMDVGMENYKADKVIVNTEKTVYTDERSKAETKMIEFEAQHKIKPLTFKEVQEIAKIKGFMGYYQNTRSGKVYAVRSKGTTTLPSGRIVDTYYLYGQDKDNKTISDEVKFRQGNWEQVSSDEIEGLWEKALETQADYRKQNVHLITGALLPIWDRLPSGRVRVVRVLTNDGNILLGRIIPENAVEVTLKKLGAEESNKNLTPDAIADKILSGSEVTLSNGWRMAKRRVSGENRIELIGNDLYTYRNELRTAGVFDERINYTTRYFIPVNAQRTSEVIENITRYRPVVDVFTAVAGEAKFKLDSPLSKNLNLTPAPEAMEQEIFQAANTLSQIFTGNDIVTFKGKGIQGMADGDTIYLNQDAKDPVLYVAKHEIVHTLETTDPVAYKRLMNLVRRYYNGNPEMLKHYQKQKYTEAEAWGEFTADVISEVMEQPNFWQMVREKAPKVIKAVVDVIDQIISKFKKAVAKDDSMLKYIDDIESFKAEVAGVVAESLSKPKRRNILDLRTDGEVAAKAKTGSIKNSKGDKINPTGNTNRLGDKMTNSAEFKKWFGDSKVVDENGEPLVVYHGTGADFNVFDINRGGERWEGDFGVAGIISRIGIFFTENKNAAEEWAEWVKINNEKPIIKEVYLSINKPKIYISEILSHQELNEILDKCKKGIDKGRFPEDFNENFDFHEFSYDMRNVISDPIRQGLFDSQELLVFDILQSGGHSGLIEQFKAKGYDGVILKESSDGDFGTQYIVFSPEQIKSTDNTGSFDPSTPDIRYKRNLLDGIGTAKREGKKEVKFKRFILPSEEVQERMEKSRGVKPETTKAKLQDALADITRKGHRELEYLPRTGRFSELRNALLKFRKQKGVAADTTLRILKDVTDGLSEYEYDIFTYKVIFDDLAHDFDAEMNLPFGLTTDNFAENKAKVDEEAENNPKVIEAIEKRREAWQGVKDDYIAAQKAVGFKVEDRLQKEDYYRHQVLEYANAKSLLGTGKKLKTPTGRGFLKQREGSTFDINTDYLQAEYEVMAQMIYDSEIAKVVRVVKEHYDIVNQLKKQAIEQNNEGMLEYFQSVIDEYGVEGPADKLFRKTLNKKQAIAFSQLYKMAAMGELPAGPNNKYEKVIQEMADAHYGNIDEAESLFDGEQTFKGELFSYLNYLSNQTESVEGQIKARTVYKGMAEKQRMIKNTLGKSFVTWEDLIPEGYSLWQPRDGHMFYMVNSIPEGLAQQLMEGIAEEVGIDKSVIKRVMVMGQNYPELVVPDEVALTLENLYKDLKEESPISKGYHGLYRFWKQWQLISPRRYFKYNARNMTGDFDAVLAGNPSSMKKMPKAWQDLWQAFFAKDKVYTPELYEWFKRGGFETLMQAQEINDINRNREFAHLMESRLKKTPMETISNLPKAAWLKYWDTVRTTTDFREALLRYASFLDYREQLQNNNGVPKNWGASNRDEIMGIKDWDDRAAKLANELLGAYDEVSVIGTALADNFLPFWRWNEVNFVRYSRLFKNAYQDGKLMGAVAGKASGMLIRSPLIAWKVGIFVIKASALLGMITAWNLLFFGDEEDDLPKDVRERLHIILGRDADGKVIYFSRLGAFQDFLDWFGVDTPVQTVRDFLNGRRTIKEIAIDIAKEDANKVINAITPFIKNFTELLLGQKMYPDAFKPQRIRDRWQYLADSFGLGNEYKALADKPTKGYEKSLADLLVYRADPYESAYWGTLDEKRRFLKEIGQSSDGYSTSPRSEALYNVKLAIRYGDRKAYEKYLLEYAAKGGTAKGLKQSLNAMNPLYGLDDAEKRAFVQYLDTEGKEDLVKAMEYYNLVIGGGTFNND